MHFTNSDGDMKSLLWWKRKEVEIALAETKTDSFQTFLDKGRVISEVAANTLESRRGVSLDEFTQQPWADSFEKWQDRIGGKFGSGMGKNGRLVDHNKLSDLISAFSEGFRAGESYKKGKDKK